MGVLTVFEHYREHLIDRKEFISRLLRHLLFASVILFFSLGIGTVGYQVFGKLPWIDAFLNASMILTGMGPVDHVEPDGGKLFSAFYALFSGCLPHVRGGTVLTHLSPFPGPVSSEHRG